MRNMIVFVAGHDISLARFNLDDLMLIGNNISGSSEVIKHLGIVGVCIYVARYTAILV